MSSLRFDSYDAVGSRSEGLSSSDFQKLCALVYQHSGIKLGPEKKIMLEGRIKRRMNHLKLVSHSAYCKHLFADHNEQELVHLIDVVTTNKTDFFRERAHFDFLKERALPDLCSRNTDHHELLIWSAGCSTGEEPYTLAMVLSEYGQSQANFRFRILATDISTAVLAKAELGIFNADAVSAVSPDLRRKYFMRSRDREANLTRIVPELRGLIEFRRLNLMEEFGMTDRPDVIFCRNVVIYFDQPTQERLFLKFSRQLAEKGYLFVGHSESLHHMDLPLVPIAPALYRKTNGRVAS